MSLFVLLACPASGGALPVETFNCGDDVDHSVKLGDDVGTFAAGCNENGLRITKSGITLDLNGHTIFGDREDDAFAVEAGVLVYLVNDVVVKNGTVRGFVDGVRATTGNDRSTFKGIVSADNIDKGFDVSGKEPTLSRNVVVRNGGRAIDISSNDSQVSNNVVTANGDAGIWYDAGNRASVTGNIISLNGGAAIRLFDSAGSTVSRNTLSGNSSGLFMSGPRMVVSKNTAVGNGGDGIWVFSDESQIVSNRASDNANDGIEVAGDDVVVSKNVSSANAVDGLHITGDRNEISRNRTDANPQNGIDADGPKTAITSNSVRGNGQNGIELTGSGRIEDNRAIGNGFAPSGTTLGIDASGATVKGGGNIGRVNDGTNECLPTTLCKRIDSGLPPADLDCGDTVSTSVRLTGDVGSSGTPCGLSGLVVTADGIEIDLDGNTIWGDTTNDDAANSSERGIDLEGRRDVHVYDGKVDGFERGISAGDSRDIRITDIEVRDSVGSGITDFSGSNRTVIERVVSTNHTFFGVQTFAAVSTMREVVALENTLGGISGSREMTLDAVVAAGNEGPGIIVFCCPSTGGTKITKSTVFNNDDEGILVRNPDATVHKSIVTNNGLEIGDFRDGIEVMADAPRTALVGNIVSFHGGRGIDADAEAVVVNGNFLAGSTGVGMLVSGDHALVKKNKSLGGSADALRMTGVESQIRRNVFVGHAGEGIDIDATDHDIVENLVAANKPDGILVDASFVGLKDNRALGNGFGSMDSQVDEIGLGIDAGPGVVGNNVAYGNDDDDGCDPPDLC